MVCEELKKGFDACSIPHKRYEQEVLLMNFSNVRKSDFDFPEINIFFNGTPYGFRFKSISGSNKISGRWEKSEDEGIPEYDHFLDIVLSGVDSETKKAFNQLDFSQYFGAIKFNDGTVEVFGFENGLKTSDYEVNPAETGGGYVISLESRAPENYAPLVSVKDLFKQFGASFNNDFNNDFDIDN